MMPRRPADPTASLRDAGTADLPALCRLRAGKVLHRDCLRDAAVSPDFQYLAVELPANGRARALCVRLGYRQIPPEPSLRHWEFTDATGHVHQGNGWCADMVRDI